MKRRKNLMSVLVPLASVLLPRDRSHHHCRFGRQSGTSMAYLFRVPWHTKQHCFHTGQGDTSDFHRPMVPALPIAAACLIWVAKGVHHGFHRHLLGGYHLGLEGPGAMLLACCLAQWLVVSGVPFPAF